MKVPGTLHFMCGKMAAGKSTLARSLAAEHSAVLISEDHLLSRLFPGAITDLAGYIHYSGLLKGALLDHIRGLLELGLPVVLDFPANTKKQRAWFREIIDLSGAPHRLHYIEVSDETCKRQLRERNASEHAHEVMQDEATFDLITSYFTAPEPEEGFEIVHHRRD